MPRNGSGTFTLVAGNPVVSGTTISSTVHNNTMSDVATALTNSVAKDGETVITGDLDFNGNALIIDTDGDSKIGELNDDVIFVSVAGNNAVLFGLGIGNTGSILHVDPAATSATASTNFGRLRVGNSAPITIPAGTTAVAAGAYFEEPNLTATGTVTAAATVYIEAAPTEGSSNYALWVDDGATKLDGSLTVDGATILNGNTTIGDASGDTLTIAPSSVTWSNNPTHSGNHTFSGTVTHSADIRMNNVVFLEGKTTGGTDQRLIGMGGDDNVYINTDNQGETRIQGTDIVFRPNSSEAARIDSNSDFGIGTSSPDARLHVVDSVTGLNDVALIETTENGSGSGALSLYKNSSSPDDNDDIFYLFFEGNNSAGSRHSYASISVEALDVTDNDERGFLEINVSQSFSDPAGVRPGISLTGNSASPMVEVRFPNIGTTGSAANAFLDSGDNNNILRSTSSIRYKTGVEDLVDSSVINHLRPITFRSKCPNDDPDRVHFGFIAEEVAETDDRLVHFKDGEPDGVQYDRIIVPLVKRSQEQEETIRKQGGIIQSLESRVASLESKLEALL